jgi:hypothetical protein
VYFYRLEAASTTPAYHLISSGLPRVPSTEARLSVAIGIGTIAFAISYYVAVNLPPDGYQDFAVWWFGARAAVHGQNPYSVVRGANSVPMFFYPLPWAWAITPFLAVEVQVAGPLFVAASCAALAFVMTSEAWWPLLAFTSGSMIMTVFVAQSSALLLTGILVPSLTWIGVFKPNIGLAMLAYRPRWQTAAVMIAILVASVAISPGWPRDWIATAASSPFHFVAWKVPGGILLFTALARWRRPEARLFLMMAVVPSSPIVYEALPLFVIPKTRQEMFALAILSNVVLIATYDLSFQADPGAYARRAQPAMMLFLFVPALLMILRRPNQGDIPECVERHVQKLPRWIRGQRTPSESAELRPSATSK